MRASLAIESGVPSAEADSTSTCSYPGLTPWANYVPPYGLACRPFAPEWAGSCSCASTAPGRGRTHSMSERSALGLERFSADSLCFRNFVSFPSLQALVLFAAAAGPIDHDALDAVLLAEAEGHGQFAL